MIKLIINAHTNNGSASIYCPVGYPDSTTRKEITAIAKDVLAVECPTWVSALLSLHYYDERYKVFVKEIKQFTIHNDTRTT